MREGKVCPSNEDGKHKFVSTLVATLPPNEDQINAADLQYPDMAEMTEALTAKRFLVHCRDCGLVAGGYSGSEAPVVEGP